MKILSIIDIYIFVLILCAQGHGVMSCSQLKYRLHSDICSIYTQYM